MELLQYWKIVRKWWWMIALSTLLFGVAGIFYSQRQVPIYTTTTTMVINPAAPSALLPYTDNYSVQSLANTYTEFMRTNSFAELVAGQLNGAVGPGTILNALSLRYVEGTQIFRITATHTDPAIAQLIANTVADTLIAENLARQRTQQQQTLNQANGQAQNELNRLTELQSVLEQEAQYYSDRMTSLESEIATLSAGPRSDERDQHVLDLRDELISSRSARIDVLGSLAQTQTTLATYANTNATPIDTAVVIDRAQLPTVPQPGQGMQFIILGFLGGLMAGGGLAWLLEYINYTVRTPEELDTHYGIPTQGAIGLSAAFSQRSQGTDSLITLHDPRSPISEAFRALRTSVRMANAIKPIRRLLFTSAGPSEGKTFIATNLAISLAQEGKRVILVDADLRRPQIHKAFGLPNEPGLTNWAVDHSVKFEEVVRPTIVPNLSVLTCGIIPPNPAELLGSERMSELIKAMDEHADIVLYDSPPAATVTDAVILATQMDGVLQVVRAGSTRIDLVQRCKTLLERINVHILGPVLNGVQSSDLGYYANYYYYGSYYQSETPKAAPPQQSKRKETSGWFGRGKKKRRTAKDPWAISTNDVATNGAVAKPNAASQWTIMADEQDEAPAKAGNPLQRRQNHNQNQNHTGKQSTGFYEI